jgi:DNA modification methylase
MTDDEHTLEELPQPAGETTVHPDELRVDGENPNEQSDEMFGLLVDNLREKGWIGNAIIANTGDLPGYDGEAEGLIADGEHRWRAAQEVGLDELLAEIRVDNSTSPAYEYAPSTDIHYEDAVEGIRERVDDDSVDIVLTDPPYGVDVDLTETLGATDVDHEGDLKNDGYEEAIDLWRAIVPELKRVLAEDGHLYAFASWKTYDDFRDVLDDVGFDVVNCVVWLKSTPNNQTAFGSGNVRYGYQHEFILYAVHDTSAARPLNRTLSDIILHKHSSQDNEHPTEKPVGLLETLIEQSSAREDVVLDPFLGSGSTAAAAIRKERDCVGFELDEKTYRQIIERRVAEAERQLEATVNAK